MPTRNKNPRIQSIIEAAASLFIEEGYQVNMAEVARRAGVAKQTVYTHFGTKDRLFEAALVHLIEPLRQLLEVDDLSIRESLQQYGRHHLERWLDERTAGLSRRLIAEATRFPHAAHTLYNNTLQAVSEGLAERIKVAVQRGEISVGDAGASAAAEILLGMLFGLEDDRRRLGLPLRDAAAREAWVRQVVDVFLRAYAPVTQALAATNAQP